MTWWQNRLDGRERASVGGVASKITAATCNAWPDPGEPIDGPRRLSRNDNYWAQTVGDDSLVVKSLFGELRTARRLR